SRTGGAGSGAQRLICRDAPLLLALNFATQSAIPSGGRTSAPSPPMPPAPAMATARGTESAPAIGASRMGTARPKRAQNRVARSRAVTCSMTSSRETVTHRCKRAKRTFPWRSLGALPERDDGAACDDQHPADHDRQGGQRAEENEIDHLPDDEERGDIEADNF